MAEFDYDYQQELHLLLKVTDKRRKCNRVKSLIHKYGVTEEIYKIVHLMGYTEGFIESTLKYSK